MCVRVCLREGAQCFTRRAKGWGKNVGGDEKADRDRVVVGSKEVRGKSQEDEQGG